MAPISPRRVTVQVSRSGLGCPVSQLIQTWPEYGHWLLSGLALLAGLDLAISSSRLQPTICGFQVCPNKLVQVLTVQLKPQIWKCLGTNLASQAGFHPGWSPCWCEQRRFAARHSTGRTLTGSIQAAEPPQAAVCYRDCLLLNRFQLCLLIFMLN